MENIVIEERQLREMLITMVVLIMVIVSATFLILGMKEKRIFYWILGFIASIFFGVCFFISLARACKRKPLITITFDGIIDSSTASSVGFIPFQDIQRFCIINRNGQQEIGVIPKNEVAFIGKLSPIKQGIAKLNASLNYPPFSIRVNGAKDMSLEDIYTLLKKRLDDYSCLYD